MAGRIILGIISPTLDADGNIASGSTLTVYENGTTTLASIYDAVDLLTPLANPLTCDSAGRFPEIWAADASYSIKWSVAGETPITYDDISTLPTAEDPMFPDGIIGTTTNDAADAGRIGEHLINTVLSAGAASLTSALAANIVTLNLTKGDWDVSGNVTFKGGATTLVMELNGGINTTTGVMPTAGTCGRAQNSYGTAGVAIFAQNNVSMNPGPVRISLAVDSPVYLIGLASFSTSTCLAFGELRARRVR